jgi:glutathione S-transferase
MAANRKARTRKRERHKKGAPMAAKYTLVIGTATWSSWSLRPYLALRHLGVDFRNVMVPLRRAGETREAILRHSPSGKVPLLKIVERGKTLSVWDSLAICETLAERHPKAGLWPANAAVRAVARSYAAEMHSGFPHVRGQLSLVFGQKLPLPALQGDTGREIERILAAWEAALKAHKGPFLFGRFCIADAMYAPVASRFDSYGVAVSKPVRAYMDRVLALPGMVAWGRIARKEVREGLPDAPATL